MTIKNSSENIKSLIKKMQSDAVFNSKFDGKIRNGLIDGYYTNVVRSQTKISFLKIKGDYNYELGHININPSPSNVFFVSMLFSIVFLSISVYGYITQNITPAPRFATLILGMLLGFGYLIGYNLEKAKFAKHIETLKIHADVD